MVINQFVVGLGWGWAAPTIPKLLGADSPFTITPDQASWIASINEIGRISGPFISPILVDNIGRKYTLVLISIMYLMVWSTVIFARDAYILYAVRIVFGMANGINDVVGGIYTTENCTPTFRGVIGGVVQLMFFGAIFVEFILATYLSYIGTAIANTAITLSVFATLFYCTETPYFSVMKGKYEEAEKNLIWLRGNVHQREIADELDKIKQGVEEEAKKNKSIFMLLASATNLKAITIVLGIHLLGAATGGSAFIPYASQIFTSSETLTADQYVILYGVIQFLAVALSPFIIEKFGRRTLLMLAFLGFTVSNVASFVLVYFHSRNYEIMFYPWLIFLSITAYGAFNSLMAPGTYAVKGELLPLSVRAIGSSIAVVGQSLASFSVAKIFFPITNMYGMEANFLMYSIMSFLTIVFIFYTLPETRGKSLHEIQLLLKKKRNSVPDDEDKKIDINGSGDKFILA